MIQVGNKIIALDVFKKEFVCDLNSCKGACCIEGDSGYHRYSKIKIDGRRRMVLCSQ